MRIPKVTKLESQGTNIKVYFTASEDLDWFRGHFEHCGILPGVAITILVTEFTTAYSSLDLKKFVVGIPQAKFVNMVFPNTELCLSISIDMEKLFVKYELTSADLGVVFSIGRLAFKLGSVKNE